MDRLTVSHSTFGEWLRECREKAGWPLRKVAAQLDIDTSVIAKIEKGQRRATRTQVEQLAIVFNEPLPDVLIRYLSEQVAYELADESCSDEVLRAAEEKIKYLRAKNTKQGEVKF